MWRLVRQLSLAAIILIATTLSALAADDIVDTAVQKRLDAAIGPPVGLPPLLASSSDRYVLIRASGGYMQVIDIANPGASETAVALELRKATAGTPFDSCPIESSSSDWTAAKVQLRAAIIGQLRSSMTVPAAKIIAAFRHAGINPHVLFDKPVYASMAPGVASTSSSPNFDRYSEKSLPASTFVVSTAISKSACAEAVAAAAVVAFGPLLILLVLTLRRKKASDTPSANTFTFGMIVPMAAALTWVLMSAHWQSITKIRDLWWGGSTSRTVAVILTPALLGFLLPFPVWLRALSKRTAALKPDQKVELTPEEQAVQRRISLSQRIPHLLIAVAPSLSLFILPTSRSSRPFVHVGIVFVSLLVSGFVLSVYRKKIDTLAPKEYSDALTWRLRSMDAGTDTRHIKVSIEHGNIASQVFRVELKGQTMFISERAAAEMTPAELDYVMLRVIHIRNRDRPWLQVAIGLAVPLPLLLLAYYSISTHHFGPSIGLALLPLTLIPFLLLSGKRQAKARLTQSVELETRMLSTLGDLASARSAATKLSETVSLSKLGGDAVGTVNTAGLRITWLGAINLAARNLGLTTPS